MDVIKSAKSAHELATLGMETLKEQLYQRGVKCGGDIFSAHAYFLCFCPFECFY